jgi:hypothetical protein
LAKDSWDHNLLFLIPLFHAYWVNRARINSQREKADLTAVWRRVMRLIIVAHLVDEEGSSERIQLARIDRSSTTDPLGMNLAEGKALLASAQQYLVKSQCNWVCWNTAHGLVLPHCSRAHTLPFLMYPRRTVSLHHFGQRTHGIKLVAARCKMRAVHANAVLGSHFFVLASI